MTDKSSLPSTESSGLSFEDKALVTGYQLKESWRRHQTRWTIGLAVAACAIGAWSVWNITKHKSESNAHVAFGAAMIELENNRPDSALARFQSIANEHGGISASKAALLGADILLRRGEWVKAEALYRRAIEESNGLPLLDGGARRGLATCLIEQGKYAPAADELSEVLSRYQHETSDPKARGLNEDPQDDLPGMATTLWQMVLLQEKLGKADEAARYADQLIRTYNESPEAKEARKWLALQGKESAA